jgi:hypothetical protein
MPTQPYNAFTVPLRTTIQDAQGNLSRPWLDFLGSVSRKAGRSALWRGVYDETLQYAVGDVVRLEDALYSALQAQPIEGLGAVEPGTDDTVWELIIDAASAVHGIPPGGEEGEVLAKASDEDYDVEWIDAPGGPSGGRWEPLTDGNYNFIFGDDGDIVMVWAE